MTRELLAEILAGRGINLTVDAVADGLHRHGWLLSLRTRGVWEFAPGARAGALGSGDPYIELRATLRRRPELPVALAYESTVWLHRLSRRPPEREVLSAPRGLILPPALRDFRVTRLAGNLLPVEIDDLPTWRTETLVVLMAHRPHAFRAWPTVGEWLPEVQGRVEIDLLLRELERRGSATWVRTGYLLSQAGLIETAADLQSRAPAGRGPFYLGPRSKKGVYDKRWDVVDSLLKTRGQGTAGRTRRGA